MEKLLWNMYSSAKAMIGKNVGFKSFFQAANYDHIIFAHCLIHREALAAKNWQQN